MFPYDLTVEESLLAWRAGEAANGVVTAVLHRAIEAGDEIETVMLKRGGKLFTVATMAQILAERNGPNYVKNLKREVVTSKKTLERLATYAQVAVVWYIQATRQMVGTGRLQQLCSILRTQDSYPHPRKASDDQSSDQSTDKQVV